MKEEIFNLTEKLAWKVMESPYTEMEREDLLADSFYDVIEESKLIILNDKTLEEALKFVLEDVYRVDYHNEDSFSAHKVDIEDFKNEIKDYLAAYGN